MNLDWDYDKREVHISMLDYVEEALKRFFHDKPKKTQDQPHPHIKQRYGAKVQYTEDLDDSLLLGKEDITFI